MSFNEKATQLVIKLIRLTNSEKIHWEIKKPPRSITTGSDDVIPIYYEAKYKDKYVAIYPQRYQEFSIDTESFYWCERIVFAVLDIEDHVLWEITDYFPALKDLLDTVREKSVGIDNLLDDLLDDD